jgi:hypothetical protein
VPGDRRRSLPDDAPDDQANDDGVVGVAEPGDEIRDEVDRQCDVADGQLHPEAHTAGQDRIGADAVIAALFGLENLDIATRGIATSLETPRVR